MEKRAKYAKLHPEMSNLDLTKILSKKYRELPDKKKVSHQHHAPMTLVYVFVMQFLTKAILLTSSEKVCRRLLTRQRGVCGEHDEVPVRHVL